MSLKFDIKKVICINIKSLNEQQIFSISENYFLSFEALVAIKKEGFEKIWVEISGDYLIAFSTDEYNFTVAENFCPITKKERDSLLKLKPVKTPRIPKSDNCLKNYQFYLNKGYKIQTKSLDEKLIEIHTSKYFDVDTILDKISVSGIKSLTKAELKFLDEQSKK